MQKNAFDLFFGSKVGQSVPIGIKLELNAWHHLLNVYTKFQTDIISKHVEKSQENFEKSKTHKNNHQNSEKIGKKRNLCREVYGGHLCTKFEEYLRP